MISIKYKKAVNFLNSLNNIPSRNYMSNSKGYDRSFFIKRLEYLLKLIDNPHKKLKYIHVAGTAGKGSTVYAIHNILKSAGYKVGSYYSPHTTTHIERIKVNNKYITPNTFANIVESLKNPLTECSLKSPYGTPSYYEVLLTIAFIYFEQRKCDWVVLEAYLGGKNDATNVIKNTKFTVITNINYDHQNILGNTLQKIAKDKMGIIKPRSTFVTTESRPQILTMFQNKCKKEKAKFISLKYKKENNKNNLIAKKIGELLNISDKNIKKALNKTKLPCRFEIMQASPKIIIDGAHNPIKIKKLVEHLKEIKYKRLILIFAMVSDKDVLKSLKEIASMAKHIVFTRSLSLVGSRKTMALLDFKKAVKKLNIKVKTDYFLDPWQALNFALSLLNSQDCLVITGSMYLVGDIRKKWISEEHILSNRKSF